MKHFLFGVVFGQLLFPLMDEVGAFVQAGLEVFTTSFQKLSMKNGVEIAKMKKEIEDIVGPDGNEDTRVIGFSIPSEECYEEEEDC